MILSKLKYAIQGIVDGFNGEVNFRIHSIVGVIVVGLGFWLGVSRLEWLILLLIISFVLSLELVNSALERAMDILHPSVHNSVRTVKDMLAGAVLISSCIALVIGLIIFLPYLL